MTRKTAVAKVAQVPAQAPSRNELTNMMRDEVRELMLTYQEMYGVDDELVAFVLDGVRAEYGTKMANKGGRGRLTNLSADLTK